jgi:hypothetical protein
MMNVAWTGTELTTGSYDDERKQWNVTLKRGDGSERLAELLVLATGYKNQRDTVRLYLGDEIADRIGPVWDFDEGGELRNMWRRTAQEGLWLTAGSLAQCRIFSRYLAIQIKALEEGLMT